MKFPSLLIAATALTALASWAQPSPSPAHAPVDAKKIAKQYANLPLAFEVNRGQAAPGAQFVARGAGYGILLRSDGSDLLLRDSSGSGAQIVKIKLLNSQGKRAEGLEQLDSNVNYLRGEKSKWITGVPTFARVRFKDVYPATDLVYYGNHGQLEYDFVLRPGAKTEAVQFRVSGAESVRVMGNGDLALKGGTRDVVWHKPVAYQTIEGKRTEVASSYVVKGDVVSFQVGSYDRRHDLVIDPALAYSTYLGGSANDNIMGVAVDASGNAYVVGDTTSADYPTTAGAYDRTCGTNGNCNETSDGPQRDVFVSKLNATGTALVYSTFLGGSDYDFADGIAVNQYGNAVVVGVTFSTDFATRSIGPSSQDTAFAAKLNNTGSGLIYAVRFGGSTCDNGSGATAVKEDNSGNAYVVGSTDCSNFGVTPGAFQPVYGGADPFTGGDGYIAKINPSGTAFVYASYLGGSQREQPYDVALDASNNAYVTGYTFSTDFPVTSNAYQKTMPSHPADLTPFSAFVSKVNASGSALTYSTYLGGSNVDSGQGIAVIGDNAVVTGWAESKDFPTTSGTIQRTLKGLSDAFVTRFNSAGSGLVYSTLLGGSSDERGGGVAVNSSGNAYVSGVTYSSDFPTTVYGFQRVQLVNGEEDVFVAELTPDGKALAFSSYLGGSSFEQDQAFPRIAVDGSRNAYVAGYTASSDFPVTPGAYQTSLNTAYDGFVSKISPICGIGTVNPSVTICTPANNASVKSPVQIITGTYDLTPVWVTQVYVDGKKVYEAHLSSLDIKLPMTVGTHRVTVQAIDVKNVVFKKTVNVTVTP